ncbi:glycerol-3-phosphate 1-O-acyltransferase PlsY [Ligilactobacillus saerimneri]|uniref:glycerol-3-phosphate 1-O-acyltransferase PlsY n=1 Tax=Ligilactobacillus saerimneri TaxID=228229 RepID=UPI000483CB4D|nr:glycerol-3-phosphate 1-O-acyltransferase PlsY [Ligilactobacillus saerimneri]MBU5309145.1 glycerol-3-phosphate 1-O-acyltransferase PlsY [Ligilactobacillus saerimneri]MCZ0891770.1 glycerol-3-phosphate 1-O-acyltransferase PlsY [Ligilactobacillus saerimneri]MDI9205777.1 glycerol-3-phosphate 1-O-acyltransferase PlsY [Ligilactobacillus saerimneri]MDY4002939.1 glycerol-3-phosphate 1-O-acyltransferase PlsY [Ligilactobacillus saerimneri]
MDLKIIIMIIIGYLLGSIPSGVWIGKYFFNKDIRNYGSGNMGTTNTFRVLGKKAGITVLLLDMLKGSLTALLPFFFGVHVNALLIGLSAILGHAFPIFAGFKGGKAVATSVGVLLVYNPLFFVIAWAFFLTTLYLTSMVSVASMVGFTLLSIVSFFFQDRLLTTVAVVLTIFVFIRHWSNIERIKNGTENMVPFGLGYKKRHN